MSVHRPSPVVPDLRIRTAITLAGFFIGALTHGCNPECLTGTRPVGGKCVAIGADGGTAGNGMAMSSVEGSNAGSTIPAAGSTGNVQTSGAAAASAGMTAGSGVPSVSSTSKPATPGVGSAGMTASTPAASANGTSGASAPNASTAPQAAQTAGSPSTPPSTCNPFAEQCDGMDNDCDGKVDEEVDPRPCGGPTAGIGTCKKGTQSCSNGQWGECLGETMPTEELCDDKMEDEDCDGVVDNGCSCTTGNMRACMNPPSCKPGMQTCTNGVWDSECKGEVRGSTEICDGMDNDCNGTKDDGGDALCGGGKRCAGAAGCVQCVADSDCSSMTTDCKDAVCNASHQCTTQAKTDHTSCSTATGNGVCRSGACSAGCIDDTDCKGTKGFCNATTRACVECDGRPGQCSTGYTCSSAGTCVSACGNHQLDKPDEECDLSVPGTTDLMCDSSCHSRNTYTPCSSPAANSAECGGNTCTATTSGSPICLPLCSGNASWSACTFPNQQTGVCQSGASNTVVCVLSCPNSVCPAGTTCRHISNNGTAYSMCL